jgi:hypothetical protein
LNKTISEIEQLSASEYQQWKAYFSIYPFSVDYLNIIQSRLLAGMYNSSCNFKKKFEPKDFIFSFLENEKVTKEELVQKVEMLKVIFKRS